MVEAPAGGKLVPIMVGHLGGQQQDGKRGTDRPGVGQETRQWMRYRERFRIYPWQRRVIDRQCFGFLDRFGLRQRARRGAFRSGKPGRCGHPDRGIAHP